MKNIGSRFRHSLRALSVTALAFTCASAATTATASVIYDNNAVPTTGGYSDSDRFGGIYGAHTFTLLPGANTITGFIWSGFYDAGTLPPSDQFTIEIYADSGGVPDLAPLHTFAVGNAVNRTDLGMSLNGRPNQGYSASIAPLTLTPGNVYWLSIFNNSGPGLADDWAWAMQNVGGTAAYRFGATSAWSNSTARQDFQIIGTPVPEPTSMLLLGSGVATLWISRRRAQGRARQ